LARRIGDGDATEHPGNFFDSLGTLQVADAGLSSLAIALLAHLQMLGAEGSHLRKMRHAKYLRALRECGEFATNDFGDGAPYTGVDFVEHHASGRVRIVRGTCRERHLHGQ
jgi:hypothetical protein